MEASFKGHYNLANQEISLSRSVFVKPIADYKVISFYGPNIIVSEHEEWKKYKKIAAPAFSEVSPSLLLFISYIDMICF